MATPSKQAFLTTLSSPTVLGAATIAPPPTGAVRDGTGQFSTITTTSAHGLLPADVAVISGVDDPSFDASAASVIVSTTLDFSYANPGTASATSGNGTVSGSTVTAANYYDGGLIRWTSGLNTGLAMEIKTYNPATQLLILFLEMPFTIGVNDTFDIWPGCDKKLDTCKNKFNNIVNFRGEPYLPGQDVFALYPDLNK